MTGDGGLFQKDRIFPAFASISRKESRSRTGEGLRLSTLRLRGSSSFRTFTTNLKGVLTDEHRTLR